jgi:hypothetical protein
MRRRFTDRTGVAWAVYEVSAAPVADTTRERREEPRSGKRDVRREPLATRPLGLPRLCFESARERRYLDTVPAGWDALPDDQLEDLLTGS